MIEITDLLKKYDDTVATAIDHLTISAGEHVGLVGNNGAGKTTMISLMLDLIAADKGNVQINGMDVQRSDQWKEITSAYLDESFVIDYLTPDEYFKFISRIRGISTSDMEDRLGPFQSFFNDQIRGQKKYIRDLSKGNKKKVGIAAALLASPQLLYLDEPFANLDPSSQIILQNIIRSLPEDMTIFISSHDLTHISEVCRRIIILENGKIVKDLETNANTLVELRSYFTAKSELNEI